MMPAKPMKRDRISKILLFSVAFLLCLQLSAKPSTASTEKVTLYATGCHICIDNYFAELRSSLSKIGITDIQKVTSSTLVAKAQSQLYQNLSVPNDMRGKCLVSVDDRFLFINYVPVDIVLDFLANYSRRFHSIVIYTDSLNEAYKILYEDGSIVECDSKDSLFESVGKTKIALPFLTVMSLIVVSGLVDSINPCAFAVPFFFIAFLYLSRDRDSGDARRSARVAVYLRLSHDRTRDDQSRNRYTVSTSAFKHRSRRCYTTGRH